MPETAPAPEPSSDDEARRRIGVRVLVVIAVVLVGLMIMFGRATAVGYEDFEAYRTATLNDPAHPPRWQTEALDVDGCVDEVLTWIEACPGVSSWCESSLPDVLNQCLDTQDLGEYCESVGDAVKSTRFGFEECSERYDQIEGRYARRYAKKHCSILYRVIAGRCSGSAF
jgi:hypothetical protein